MEQEGNFPELQTSESRQMRVFSEELKKKIVVEIESKRMSVSDVAYVYNVNKTSVYKWIYKYSKTRQQGERIVVASNTAIDKIKTLEAQVAELERALGRKQLQIDFLDRTIGYISEDVGYDVKKKMLTEQFSGIEKTVSKPESKTLKSMKQPK